MGRGGTISAAMVLALRMRSQLLLGRLSRGILHALDLEAADAGRFLGVEVHVDFLPPG
jgi:hypothetical protein